MSLRSGIECIILIDLLIQVGHKSPIYLWEAGLNRCLQFSWLPSVCPKLATALPRYSGGAAIPTQSAIQRESVCVGACVCVWAMPTLSPWRSCTLTAHYPSPPQYTFGDPWTSAREFGLENVALKTHVGTLSRQSK